MIRILINIFNFKISRIESPVDLLFLHYIKYWGCRLFQGPPSPFYCESPFIKKGSFTLQALAGAVLFRPCFYATL